MKYRSFIVEDFLVPEFTLARGKMIRFRVSVLLVKENRTNADLGVKNIFNIIENYNNQKLEQNIYYCPNELRMKIFDFIKPIKVDEYLENIFGLRSCEIIKDLYLFNIKPEYVIRQMGFAHQKLFSIVCGIEQNDITAFDFYGFAPDTEIQLMKYVHTKLDEGKSLIAFDNLGFIEDNFDKLNIENLIIKRI